MLFAIAQQHLTTIGLVIALVVVSVVAVTSWLFRKDTAMEQRQRAWVRLAAFLHTWGFEHLATIVQNLAIKDLSGVITETAVLVRMMENEEQAIALLEKNFFFQLEKRIQRPNDWQKIQRIIQDRAAAERAEATRRLESYKAQQASAEQTEAAAGQAGPSPAA